MKRTGDYKFRPVVNFYNNSGARGERNEMAHRGGRQSGKCHTGASLADSMQKDSVLPCLGKHGVLYFDPAGTTFTLRELIYSSGLLMTQ